MIIPSGLGLHMGTRVFRLIFLGRPRAKLLAVGVMQRYRCLAWVSLLWVWSALSNRLKGLLSDQARIT